MFSRGVSLALTLALSACVTPKSTSPANQARIRSRSTISLTDEGYTPPGWFDLGIGMGTAFETTSDNDNDVTGVLFSVKAYPFGRWYSFDANADLKPITGRNTLLHRTSVVYGVSVGELTGGSIDGPIHVLAAGFDVAPQLAVVAGVGLFEEDRASGSDTDFAFYLGFSLNLNSFRNLGKVIFGDEEEEPGPT